MAPRPVPFAVAMALAGCGRLDFELVGTDTGCGAATLLADDFEDGLVAAGWDPQVGPNTSFEEAGGQAVFQVQAAPGERLVELTSQLGYDLSESAFSVEVTQPPPATSDTFAFLMAQSSQGNLSINLQYGELHCFDVTAVEVCRTTFDPIAHRFWRLRGAAGTTYFETAPDGISWTEIGRTPTPASHVAARLNIGAQSLAAETVTVAYDSVNGGGAPTGSWCPAEGFQDDFDDGVLDARWFRWGQGCGLDEIDGGFAIAAADGVVAECGIASVNAFSLEGSAFSIEASSVTAGEAWTAFVVGADAGAATFVARGGTLFLDERIGTGPSETLATIAYDAATHRYWRVSEDRGAISWETSPDGLDWTVELSRPVTYSITAVTVTLDAGITATPSPGFVARFDNLNVRADQ